MNQDIKTYDFKKPQRYSADNMTVLSVISEDFCKILNSYLAYELKKQNIVLKVEKIEQTNYEDFINMIATDSVIVEHAIQPLVQGLIYQIDKEVALEFIDLMVGGDGLFDNHQREFTEIDKHLITNASSNALTKLHIVEGCEYREVLSVHTNVGSSKKFPISESVLIAHMKMMYGEKEVGRLRFCNPYSCMEPILDQLESKKLFKTENINDTYEFTNALYNNINESKVDISARLGKSSISVGELLNIKVGDVIKLDTKIDEDIELNVENSKSFRCKPGLINDKKGIVITGNIKKEV